MFDKIKLHFLTEAGTLNTLGKIALVLLYFVIALIVVKIISFIIGRLAKKSTTSSEPSTRRDLRPCLAF